MLFLTLCPKKGMAHPEQQFKGIKGNLREFRSSTNKAGNYLYKTDPLGDHRETIPMLPIKNSTLVISN